MKRISYLLLLVVTISVSGCLLLPPLSEMRTPAVSGRVVDAVTHRPISGATLSWLEPPEGSNKKLDTPTIIARTDGTFSVPRNDGHSGVSVVWMPPHGGYWEAGGTKGSYLLQVEAPGYEPGVVNVDTLFKASGLRDKNGGDNIHDYKNEFPIGEFALKTGQKEPNQAREPTAPSGRGSP